VDPFVDPGTCRQIPELPIKGTANGSRRSPSINRPSPNQLGFTRNFLTPAQREEPSPEDICAVLAAVMAHGCNLGVYTMAQLTSDVISEQLKRIGDWHLTEEAQRSALAELVSAITDLDTSSRWGEGRTAASDGQRFLLPHRVLVTLIL
jgi:Tn3 transposase DDE domain